MQNHKAIVRYDGTAFHGWQVQPGKRTLQGELESALSKICGHPIRIAGAGRTDAGVHALAQVFSFRSESAPPPARLRRSLSRMLGPELRIESVEHASGAFHARYSATGKHYAYVLNVDSEPDPFSARYAWRVPRGLDLDVVASLCSRLAGKHDFAGFQGSGSAVEDTVRTLDEVALRSGGVTGPHDAAGLWHLDFHGTGFLYKMVRNITGTLVDIGRGRLKEDVLWERLASPGPYHGHTAPGHGLTLVRVDYD